MVSKKVEKSITNNDISCFLSENCNNFPDKCHGCIRNKEDLFDPKHPTKTVYTRARFMSISEKSLKGFVLFHG